ncbi:reverse transcriptase domain-containing protein [Tanacetum coccineum]|uniref:Reverse transcriptase domain-containing protein n=1 Tax=Tanacetum coccineum TaxID=301880 RepID=A0ABQ4Y465_9ASTR
MIRVPCWVAPKPKEELIIYLSASYGAVSAVLMTERSTVQTPVYFISRALQGPELNYTPIEKLVLSLVFAAKRLQRLQKWSVMLGEHNITYRPRTSVKGQILADFLIEKPDENLPDTSAVETPPEPWILFTDRSSCVDRSGAGLILTNPEGAEFTYALRFQFTASNNEALIAGLRIAAQIGVRNIQVSVDSKLVANQVPGTYVAKEDNMIKYLEKVKSLVSGLSPNFFHKPNTAPVKPRSRCPEQNHGQPALPHLSKKSWSSVCKGYAAGYYVATMNRGASDMDTYLQRLSIHRPVPETLRTLTLNSGSVDVYQMGVDISPVGLFPEGPGKVKFLIVAMDYFTKWIKAKVVATITGNQKSSTCRIDMPTYRTAKVDTVHNDKELRLNLDLLEEKRERATICEAKSKMKMTKYYNARVRGVAFRPGDFIYRSNDASHAAAGGKLGPKHKNLLPDKDVGSMNAGLEVHIRPCQNLVKHLAVPMCLSPFAKRIRIHNYRKVRCKAFVSDEPISSTQLELGAITSGRVAEYLGRTIGTGTIGNGSGFLALEVENVEIRAEMELDPLSDIRYSSIGKVGRKEQKSKEYALDGV